MKNLKLFYNISIIWSIATILLASYIIFNSIIEVLYMYILYTILTVSVFYYFIYIFNYFKVKK